MKLHIKEAIEAYAKINPVRLHMPGHKGEKQFSKLFPMAVEDVTEIDFLQIEKAVKNAEEDVAKIYNADFCRLLSAGATCGIFAMLYAVKDFGKKIIINRSAHKSVYNALTVLGIRPIVLGSEKEDGLESLMSAEETEKALIKNPDAIGVFYTYPDYYGRVFDIEKVAEVVRKYGKLLLIDNAHGTHYNFINPSDYAGNYASMWVDGAHKTLSSINQGAIVFSNDKSLSEKLSSAVDVFMTTSPSYPILASVEYGVKHQQELKEGLIKNKVKESVEQIKNCLDELGIEYLKTNDIYKLSVDFFGSGLSAFGAEKVLSEFNIYPEMNDGRRIVFMFSARTEKREFSILEEAFRKIKETCAIFVNTKIEEVPLPKRKLSYLNAKKNEGEWIDIIDAEGRVSACDFGIFPPCYPLVLSGEVINKEVIERIRISKNTFGLLDGKVKVIKNER